MLVNFLGPLVTALSGKDKFKQELPAIFDEVDQVVPRLIGKADGHEVELVIARIIANRTKSPATRKQLNAIIDLYSPVKAAIKAFRAG